MQTQVSVQPSRWGSNTFHFKVTLGLYAQAILADLTAMKDSIFPEEKPKLEVETFVHDSNAYSAHKAWIQELLGEL